MKRPDFRICRVNVAGTIVEDWARWSGDYGAQIQEASERCFQIAGAAEGDCSMKEAIRQAADAAGVKPEDLCTFLLARGIRAVAEDSRRR